MDTAQQSAPVPLVTVVGTQANDLVVAPAPDTLLMGLGGDDLLRGYFDFAPGGAIFVGGAGNDMLLGATGADVYRFELHEGIDTIVDRNADFEGGAAFFNQDPNLPLVQDRIEFGAGIAPEDVLLERAGFDLRLTLPRDPGNPDDVNEVKVVDWFADGMLNKIEQIVFVDGTTWLASDVDHMLGEPSPGVTLSGSGTLTGTQYDDVLTATAWLTTLEGGAGNDLLAAAVDGGVFNLVFDGGRGNDMIAGSYAGDSYVYALGDGNDRIHDDVRALGPDVAAFFAAQPGAASYQDALHFGAGITKADVSAERLGQDLVLHVGASGSDSITVEGWYDGTMFNKIETFLFADGTAWFASEVDQLAGQPSTGLALAGGGVVVGSQYDDTLSATAFGTVLQGGWGNDVLRAGVDGGIFGVTFEGGHGNDVIEGSYAGDTYRFSLGDGRDAIHDDVRFLGSAEVAEFFAANLEAESYQDRLEFGAGIHAADVQLSRVGSDLLLTLNEHDGVKIQGWYDGTVFEKIETIAFADGTTWHAADVDRMLGQPSAGIMLQGAGTLAGSPYDDYISATGFGTVLLGGGGNDRLMAATDGGVFALTFEGGAGNDLMTGSYAGDVYRFAVGDGRDSIHDDVRVMGPDIAAFFAANSGAASYQDRIEFGEGIHAADVQFWRRDLDLLIDVNDQEGIRVINWYDGTMFNKIETIAFADGTTLSANDLDHLLGQASTGVVASGSGTVSGSQYDDSLQAAGYGTVLQGGAGNDTLSAAINGGIFDVTFAGGRGNDVMLGSYARDFYVHDLGDGRDVIVDDVRALNPDVAAFFAANPTADTYQDHLQFGAGISADAVTRTRVGDNLVFSVGADDAVTVQDWFDGTPFHKIELIGFADGTTWTAAMAEQGLA